MQNLANKVFDRAALFTIMSLERCIHDAPLHEQHILHQNENEIIEHATPDNLIGKCMVQDMLRRDTLLHG